MLLLYFFDALILILLIFMPTNFFLFGIICIIHYVTILIDQPENNMGLLIFITGILVLALTGFFRKKGKIKTVFFALIFQISIFSEIRFGSYNFIFSIFSKIHFFFIMILILLFAFRLSLDKLIFTSDKILDLSAFPDLTIRDTEWIELILKETKYETIARKYNLSEGTVKNNFARIFKILNVSDRIHFMSVYGGCKVLKENSSRTKVSVFFKRFFLDKSINILRRKQPGILIAAE